MSSQKRHINEEEIKVNSLKIARELKKHLGKKIKKGKVAIAAVARGGLIPTQYIAYALGIRDIYCITSKLYDGEQKGSKEQEVGNLMMVDYETFDYIIVIDDIYDSGETMEGLLYAFGEIAAAFEEDTKFIPCVTFTQKKKKFMQDNGIIYGEKIKKINGVSPWLVFPWDEDMEGKSFE
jgi:hypoxanthine phosphoribosyltransferase